MHGVGGFLENAELSLNDLAGHARGSLNDAIVLYCAMGRIRPMKYSDVSGPKACLIQLYENRNHTSAQQKPTMLFFV